MPLAPLSCGRILNDEQRPALEHREPLRGLRVVMIAARLTRFGVGEIDFTDVARQVRLRTSQHLEEPAALVKPTPAINELHTVEGDHRESSETIRSSRPSSRS